MPKKPKHTIRIKHKALDFTEEGIYIVQGERRYPAEPVEIDDIEYFRITKMDGSKVWAEIDYSE